MLCKGVGARSDGRALRRRWAAEQTWIAACAFHKFDTCNMEEAVSAALALAFSTLAFVVYCAMLALEEPTRRWETAHT